MKLAFILFGLLVSTIGLACAGRPDAPAAIAQPSAATPAPAVSVASAEPAAAPSASAAPAPAPSSSAPAQPQYHAGDYKALLPSGSISLNLPDGGSLRLHDGNEHPCTTGCIEKYNKIVAAVVQATGKAPSDMDAILKDCVGCIRACQAGGADKIFWPPVEK